MTIRRWALLGATAAVLLIGGRWFLDVRSPHRDGRGRRITGDTRRVQDSPLGLPVMPDASLLARLSGFGRQPRILANLAARSGPFLISVRQLTAGDGVRSISTPLEDANAQAPVGPWQVSIQVHPLVPTDGRVEMDPAALRAIDETGYEMAAGRPSAPVEMFFASAGARTFAQVFAAPQPGAKLLRSIRGRLVHTGAGREADQWPFEISNVPLPTHERLFGDVTVLVLRQSSALRGLAHPQALVGDDIETASAGAAPEETTGALPHLGLVLPVGVTSNLGPVLPPDAPPVALQTNLGADGHILAMGSVGADSWRIKVWDGEPFLLALPATSARRSIALLLHVSRSDELTLAPASEAVFPAQGTAPAGSLVVRLRVHGRPLGPALLPFSIQRRDAGRWSAARGAAAPVRATGEAIIGNLAAGRYRVTFHTGQISPLGVSQGLPIGEYLRRRYGVRAGTWRGDVQEVSVEPGQRTYGERLYFEPAKGDGPLSEAGREG